MAEEKDDNDLGWLYSSTEPIPPWSQASQASLEQTDHHTYHSPMFSLGHEKHTALSSIDEHIMGRSSLYDTLHTKHGEFQFPPTFTEAIHHYEPGFLPCKHLQKSADEIINNMAYQ
jgi:hypothetical protein